VGRQFAGKLSVLESAAAGGYPLRNSHADSNCGPRMTIMVKMDYPQITLDLLPDRFC
jgi:hypothetical protein